tara:strand:- start:6402 stop:6797 length:396 start_codon:yes stop_codon:yes gene_type:complete
MDHLKLLDGTVEEITAGVASLTPAERAALLKAEQDGKKRKGVIAVLQPGDGDGADGSVPANIAPATKFEPSGAPIQAMPDIDPSHPAVDADPRANTTVDQNRIDFNDPIRSGVEIVSEQLGMTGPADVDSE